MITEFRGSPPSQAAGCYEAIILTARAARILGCAAGSPAFRITRVSRNTAGQLFEICTPIVRGDINKYGITLKRDSIMFSRAMTKNGG